MQWGIRNYATKMYLQHTLPAHGSVHWRLHSQTTLTINTKASTTLTATATPKQEDVTEESVPLSTVTDSASEKKLTDYNTNTDDGW